MNWEKELVMALIKANITDPYNQEVITKAIGQEVMLRGYTSSDISRLASFVSSVIPGESWKNLKDWAKEWELLPRSHLLGLSTIDSSFPKLKQELEQIIPMFLSGSRFDPEGYAEWVVEHNYLKGEFVENQGAVRLWMYVDSQGIWKMNPEPLLENTIRMILPTKYNRTTYINEVITRIKSKVLDPNWIPVEEPPSLIPFNNVILDLETLKTYEYSPKFFFVNKLAAKWTANTDFDIVYTPTFDALFQDWGQDPEVLKAIIGYTFWREYPIHKIFFLVGEGSNGKGTFIRIIQRILGKQNYSSVSIYKLAHERFATANLWSKFANFSTETELAKMETAHIKQLTGQDPITAEFKNKPSFQFTNYAKLFVLGNNMPIVSDNSPGWYRRLFITEWDRTFSPKEANPNILNGIPKEEWDKLVIAAVLKLKELKEHQFVEAYFPGAKAWKEIQEEYEKITNPIPDFVKRKLIKTDNPEDYVFLYEFADRFTEYLEKTKHPQRMSWYKILNNRKRRRSILLEYIPDAEIDDRTNPQTRNPNQALVGYRWREDVEKLGDLKPEIAEVSPPNLRGNRSNSGNSYLLQPRGIGSQYKINSNNYDNNDNHAADPYLTSTIQSFLDQLPSEYLAWSPEELYPYFIDYAEQTDIQVLRYAKEGIIRAISEALKQDKGDGVNESQI